MRDEELGTGFPLRTRPPGEKAMRGAPDPERADPDPERAADPERADCILADPDCIPDRASPRRPGADMARTRPDRARGLGMAGLMYAVLVPELPEARADLNDTVVGDTLDPRVMELSTPSTRGPADAVDPDGPVPAPDRPERPERPERPDNGPIDAADPETPAARGPDTDPDPDPEPDPDPDPDPEPDPDPDPDSFVENGRHVRFLKVAFDTPCILSIVASQKKSHLMLDSLKGKRIAMEERISLSTTIVPEWGCLQRMCDAWSVRNKWRKKLLESGGVDVVIRPAPTHPLDPIPCPRNLLTAVHYIQDVHDSTTLRSIANSMCRTKAVRVDDVRAILPAEYACLEPITCGGMSRIYAAKRVAGDSNECVEHVIVKVTDRTTSLGRHEHYGYKLIQDAGIETAKVVWHDSKGKYDIIVLQRLDCTLTSILTAIAHNQTEFMPIFELVMQHIASLVHALSNAGISFCDLSADNIMCRHDPVRNTLHLVLIDPQFALPTTELARHLGKKWATHVDRIHLAMKIRALSLLSHGTAMRVVTRKACDELLGFVPSDADVHMWLTRKLPACLRIAYHILCRLN